MSPTFSIIIPVYNVAPYLRECLDSVLAQTYTDWEAICVDDGSTDGSGAILDEYAARDSRFRAIRQANAGVSAARNVGLEKINGEYIIFLDGDDLIRPEMCDWVLQEFDKWRNVDSLMYTGVVVDTKPPKMWDELPHVVSVERCSSRTSATYLAARSAGFTTIYRKSRLGRLRFNTDLTMSEDTLFNVSYYWQTTSWLVTDAQLYFYRQRNGSAVNAVATLKKAQDWLVAENMIADLLNANKNKWNCADMCAFFKWNLPMIWYTYRDMAYKISFSEMGKILPLWVSLNKKYNNINRFRWLNRLVLCIVATSKSPILWKTLVVGIRSFKAMVCKIRDSVLDISRSRLFRASSREAKGR